MFMRAITKIGLAGVLSLSYIVGTPQKAYSDDTKQETKAPESIDDLTQTEVDTLMQRATVDDILKEEYTSGRIQKVKYNSSTGKTNFRELVYQENIPKEQRKPVVMLVADSDGKGWFDKEKYVGDKADAIIVKSLTKKYKNFMIVSYDPSIAPDFKETREGKVNFGSELKKENVSISPSILVYGAKAGNDFERLYRFNGGKLGVSANVDVLKFEINLTDKIKSYRL